MIQPFVILSSPPNKLRSVDLPEPLLPITKTRTLLGKVKLIQSNAL